MHINIAWQDVDTVLLDMDVMRRAINALYLVR